MRIGRLLEVMDSAAGISVYRYGQNINLHGEFIVATACIDSINIFSELHLGQDVLINSFINSVGRTSAEV